MQSYSRYLFNVIERIRARNKFVFTYYKFCEGGRWKNRDICNFCNPFESIQNIYIYIYYELSESYRNEEDKYIHVRIPGGCTYTVVSNILARPRTSVNLTVDLVSDTLLPPKHR